MDVADRWFLFSTLPQIGPIKQRQLLEYSDSFDDFFADELPEEIAKRLSDTQKTHLKTTNSDALERFQAWLDHPNHHIITIQDPNYPALLKEIADSPLVLYAIGNPELLRSVQISIVGSRNPSTSGRRLAEDFSAGLTQFGFTVTSGLALGAFCGIKYFIKKYKNAIKSFYYNNLQY